ncbi:MAG: VOC family protein [Chloroflexota bacterium]|nr:VOC family protein [Chloroflexota bacterium]
MTETAQYAPGTPSWVDLGSPDLAASKAFYGELFGWEAQVAPESEAGGYTMFLFHGKAVAGLGPLMQPNQPPAWTTYVSIDDANATIAKVRAAGGAVVVEPMSVLQAGRMAIFTDPTGAYLSIWEPGEHGGAEVVNQPNSLSWNELATRDIETAKTFYQAVFGWESVTHPAEMIGSYNEFQLGGKSIAGGMQMTDQFPPQVPAHWLPYFTVEDCDATVSRAQELGARLSAGPMDIPQGRFAVIGDPQGAVFAVISLPS